VILITGGGTGGHLRIAKTINLSLVQKGIKTFYIGSQKGQDQQWFKEDENFQHRLFLKSTSVVNRSFIGKIGAISTIFKSALSLQKIFKSYQIKAVFSVGGYSAAPAVLASILFRIPLYIHEQNATIGALNRLSRPFCTAFFSSFEPNSICQNYPVSDAFFTHAKKRTQTKTILFLGGSLGASAINDLALELAASLLKKGYTLIHQSGERDFQRVSSFYQQHQLEVTHFAFSTELLTFIREADFAISRAGASTLFELAANQLPTLFIPFPHAAGNHQVSNAQYLVDANAAYMIEQSELTTQKAFNIITQSHTQLQNNLENVIKTSGTVCISAILEARALS
jgi:UDP-N-acetylglucosamine--N-acetylmuramyl-(pentapeptide) pyrophosphoryl-undecaprenol N-acetylglucosamine transferase